VNHLSARQKQAITEASRDRRNFANRVEPVLSFAGKIFAEGGDFADLVEECSHGGEDGIAVVLKAVVWARLSPAEYEQESCRVDWLVEKDDGEIVSCPDFRGKIVYVGRRGPRTEIWAATGGYGAAETPIGESPADDREFVGYQPDTALYDMFSALQDEYEGVEVPRIAEPVLYAREEPFSWSRYVSEAIAWVEEQAACKAADAPWNVASAYPLLPADESGESVWDAEEGRDCGVGEMEDGTPEGERFYRVVVKRLEGSGSATEGQWTPLAEASVDNANRRVNPRSTKFLDYDTEAGTESASTMAYEEASRLSSLPSEMTVPLVYPPLFLRRGQAISAAQKEYLPTAIVSTRHAVRADRVLVDVVGRAGSVSGEAKLLGVEEERLEVPAFRPAGGLAVLPFGLDAAGGLQFEGVSWTSLDEEGFIRFTEDAPVALDEEGYYVVPSV
jgi:hypothetical protein